MDGRLGLLCELNTRAHLVCRRASVFYAMGDGDRGVARITDKECAKFILGCADCWDEFRYGWEVVFVNGGTRLHVSEQFFREVVSLGLHLANCLGEDHEATLDFPPFYRPTL